MCGEREKIRTLLSRMFVLTIKVDSDIIAFVYFEDDQGVVRNPCECRALMYESGALMD